MGGVGVTILYIWENRVKPIDLGGVGVTTLYIWENRVKPIDVGGSRSDYIIYMRE